MLVHASYFSHDLSLSPISLIHASWSVKSHLDVGIMALKPHIFPPPSVPSALVVDQSQAVKFALDIASGMAFLHTLEPMVSRLYLNSKHIMVRCLSAVFYFIRYLHVYYQMWSRDVIHLQIDEDMTARISMADAKFSFQCPGRMYSPAWMAPEGIYSLCFFLLAHSLFS